MLEGLLEPGKAFQGQTLYLVKEIHGLQTKTFYNIGPWEEAYNAKEKLEIKFYNTRLG